MRTYEIEKMDGLYCVFKNCFKYSKIIAAYETKAKAEEAIERFKGNSRKVVEK